MLLSADQASLRDLAQAFVAKEVTPHSRRWEHERALPVDVLRKMGKIGLLSMTVPTELGGSGADDVAAAAALMEIAAGDAALATIVSGQNSLGCMPLVKFGTPEQQQRFLLPLTCGDALSAFALTEPQAGSDATNLTTTATRVSSGWVINGVKQFITGASMADFVLVIATIDKDLGRKGLTAFLVPTSSPGYRVTRVENKMGQHASDTCEVLLDDVEVGDDAVLGDLGRGYAVALSNLEGGRIGTASQCVGIARAALDRAVAYAKERVTFGKVIAGHQAVALRIGTMASSVEAARQLVFHAAALKAAGEPCLMEASMAKLVASDTAERVCSDAIMTLGGAGYLVEYDVERLHRAAVATRIYEGTNDIQRLVISRELTGISAL